MSTQVKIVPAGERPIYRVMRSDGAFAGWRSNTFWPSVHESTAFFYGPEQATSFAVAMGYRVVGAFEADVYRVPRCEFVNQTGVPLVCELAVNGPAVEGIEQVTVFVSVRAEVPVMTVRDSD